MDIDRGLRILIIGNGFDIMHGLPTSYKNFLDVCEFINNSYSIGRGKEYVLMERIDSCELCEQIKGQLKETLNSRSFCGNDVKIDDNWFNAIHEKIVNNIWYLYFRHIIESRLIRGSNWIDFESEIRDVIQYADITEPDISVQVNDLLANYSDYGDNSRGLGRKMSEIRSIISEVYSLSDINEMSVRDLRDRLHSDLNDLTTALDIYLSYFVENINCAQKDLVKNIRPDCVFSFNYTDTYERVYKTGAVVSYIHGKCGNDKDLTELVLGIDEYWSDEKDKESKVNYAVFKKFVQRIIKHSPTDYYKYKRYIDEVYKSKGTVYSGGGDIRNKYADGVSHVYVIGHSLDVTDKDVLHDYMYSDATNVTVFCKDAAAKGELVAKMISLIGEERLILKTSIQPSKMHFVDLETEAFEVDFH